MAEVSLYAPVKKFLEGLDFVVKGEVGHCDVVGVREGEPPVVVICELKMQFNLELVLQAVDRAAQATRSGSLPACRRAARAASTTAASARSAGGSASGCSG